MQLSRYPLPQRQRPDQVKKAAPDETEREERELAATNEVLDKMCGQIQSRESKDNYGPVGSILSRIGVGEGNDGTSRTSEEVRRSAMC